MKWSEVFEEQDKLERKKELITVYNTVEGILTVAKMSDNYKEFTNNLQVLLDQLAVRINKK